MESIFHNIFLYFIVTFKKFSPYRYIQQCLLVIISIKITISNKELTDIIKILRKIKKNEVKCC